MRYLSVCSGVEAASLAWHTLGWTPVAFSEIEPFPCAVLAHRFPHVPNLGDLNGFHGWPDLDIDLLVGGTPCQAFSVAGLRGGLADPRGNLALTYLALADRYRPRWLVWENVPGVLSSSGGRDFGSFLGALGLLGYRWSYRILDAQYVRVDGMERAVPQRRRRVFVVGHLGERASPGRILLEPESLRGDPAPRRTSREDVADALAASSGRRGGVGTEPRCNLVATTLRARDMSRGVDSDCTDTLIAVGGSIAYTLRGEGFDASEDGTGRGTPVVGGRGHLRLTGGFQDGGIAGTVCAKWSKGTGGPAEDEAQNLVYGFQPRIARNGRGDMGDVCSALTAQAGETGKGDAAPHVAVGLDTWNADLTGDVAHTLRDGNTEGTPALVDEGWIVRRLTPMECERLQGFPDGWTDVPWKNCPNAPDGLRYKACGNSMAVNCMRWLGERIALEDFLYV